MKKLLFIKILVFFCSSLFANVAQPGLWACGGTGSFSLLFEEDSNVYHKVQMQKESISIQLYKGYAVVKGEYWMFNYSDENIIMNAGYPINASYNSSENTSYLAEIVFDKMYALQVKIDGKIIDYEELDFGNNLNGIYNYGYDQSQWYVWENTFKANDLTKVEVWFIVNTNNAMVTEGYDNQSYNGFIYVLETGASWKPPINKGEIIIQFMDGLNKNDVKGMSSTFSYVYSTSNKILYTSFSDLVPRHDDNVVITYHDRLNEFRFEEILINKTALFQSINQLSKVQTVNLKGEAVSFGSPFEIPNFGSYFVATLLFGSLFGLPILLGLVIIFLLYKIYIRFFR